MAYTKIAYEPHPVTPERKRELNAQGFKVVDIVFAPPEALKHVVAEEEAPAVVEQPKRGRKHAAQKEGDE